MATSWKLPPPAAGAARPPDRGSRGDGHGRAGVERGGVGAFPLSAGGAVPPPSGRYSRLRRGVEPGDSARAAPAGPHALDGDQVPPWGRAHGMGGPGRRRGLCALSEGGLWKGREHTLQGSHRPISGKSTEFSVLEGHLIP